MATKYDLNTISGRRASNPSVSSALSRPASMLQTRSVPAGRRTVGSRLRSGVRATGKYLSSDQFGEGVANVMPYVSNVVGLFRQAPMPPTPEAEQAITPSLVRYDAARANVDRATVAANKAASRYLSGQAAGAVQAANLATQLGSYSDVAMNEANANAQIRNTAGAQNAQIAARNTERANQYQQDVLARNLAQQREASENLANFADKAVQDRARRDMMKLDKEKFDLLSRMYTSGVLERSAQGTTTPGTVDEKIKYDPSKNPSSSKGKPYWKKAHGGQITRFTRLKNVHG